MQDLRLDGMVHAPHRAAAEQRARPCAGSMPAPVEKHAGRVAGRARRPLRRRHRRARIPGGAGACARSLRRRAGTRAPTLAGAGRAVSDACWHRRRRTSVILERGTLGGAAAQTLGRDLPAAVPDARVDRPVLRGRAAGRRQVHRLDAQPGRLPAARGARRDARRAERAGPLHPRRRLGLLWPQRRRRCRRRCGAARARAARPAGARAVDARGRARLGAVRPADGRQHAGDARRRRPHRRLAVRGLEQHALDAARRGRQPARRRRIWRCRSRRRRPSRSRSPRAAATATRFRSTSCRTPASSPFPAGDAAARLGAARRSAPT